MWLFEHHFGVLEVEKYVKETLLEIGGLSMSLGLGGLISIHARDFERLA